MSQDDLSSPPASVEELQQLVLRMHQQMAVAQSEAKNAQREAALQKQKNVELSATVAFQTQRLEKSERTIRELLAALKGKTRERIDPNQLLLFDLGDARFDLLLAVPELLQLLGHELLCLLAGQDIDRSEPDEPTATTGPRSSVPTSGQPGRKDRPSGGMEPEPQPQG